MTQRRLPADTGGGNSNRYERLVVSPMHDHDYDYPVASVARFDYRNFGGKAGFGSFTTNENFGNYTGVTQVTSTATTTRSNSPLGTIVQSGQVSEYGLLGFNMNVDADTATTSTTFTIYADISTEGYGFQLSPPGVGWERYGSTYSRSLFATTASSWPVSYQVSINSGVTDSFTLENITPSRRGLAYVGNGSYDAIAGNYYVDSPSWTMGVKNMNADVDFGFFFASVYVSRFDWTQRTILQT
jgi:hypothetical protein